MYTIQSGHLLIKLTLPWHLNAAGGGGEGALGAVGGVGASRHQEYEFIMYLTQFC